MKFRYLTFALLVLAIFSVVGIVCSLDAGRLGYELIQEARR